MSTDPDSVPSPTDPAGAPADGLTDPLGPAPLDGHEFDTWARLASDTWQRARVYEEAERRWADRSLPLEQRALAAVWGAPIGSPPAEEVAELLEEPGLDGVVRARLRAALAAVRAAADPAAAVSLAEQAVSGVADHSVAIRTRLGVWLTASEVYVRAGRPKDALQLLSDAGEAVKVASDAPAWAFAAIDAERLSILAPITPNRRQLAESVEKVAEAAFVLPPSPTVLDVLVKTGQLLSATGAAARAERYVERAVEASNGVGEAQGIRFQALLVLADAQFAAGEPDAAMESQRTAIATIEPLGATPMKGWAHHGLGVQLRATDRHLDAAAAFGDAAAVYVEAGMPYDAAALRLERAESLLQADDAESARRAVGEVLDDLDQLTDDHRVAVEMRANQVLAQVSAYEGELESAAEHWLEVADLAPRIGVSALEARLNAAQLFAADGDLDEANAQFGRAELSAADEPDPAQATATVMRVRAETLREAGEPEEAAEMARVASNHARTSGDEAQAVYLAVIAADSLHAAGQSQAAVQLYEENIQAAQAAKMPALEGAVRAGYAGLLRDMGRHDDAEAQDAEAARLGGGAPPQR